MYLKRNQVKGCESERRLRSCDRSRSLDLHYAGQELFYSYPCRVSSVDSGTESYYGGQEHQRSQDVSPCIPTSGRSSYYLKRPASSLEPIVGSPLSSEDVGHFSQTVSRNNFQLSSHRNFIAPNVSLIYSILPWQHGNCLQSMLHVSTVVTMYE